MSWYCRHRSDRFAFSTERGTSSAHICEGDSRPATGRDSCKLDAGDWCSKARNTDDTNRICRVSDPVGSGFVASLARSGGNITGLSHAEALLASKWLELLSAIVPSLRRAAMMFNPDTAPYV